MEVDEDEGGRVSSQDIDWTREAVRNYLMVVVFDFLRRRTFFLMVNLKGLGVLNSLTTKKM